MAMRVADLFLDATGALRYEPVAKRVRADAGGEPVLDSDRAVLVWEPGRVVPQYAVPESDVRAALEPAAPDAGPRHGPGPQRLGPGGREVLTPDTGFGVHTCDGAPVTVVVGGQAHVGAGFRPADPDLAGYVVVDFDAFTWREEDEPVVSHPRDPFHRIDVRASSRHVRIEHGGRVLAESRRPALLFETHLPTRYYLPRADVDTALLAPSDTVTACAYKGVASYLSLPDVPDVAWYYPEPLPDAAQIAGLVSFFTERVDVVLDGVRRERAVSPWS